MWNLFLSSALAEEAAADAAEKAAEPGWLQTAFGKFGETPLSAWIVVLVLGCLGGILWAAGRSSKKWNARTVAFGAISIALSLVLSCIRLYRMPQGGSVTLGSMLPIMLFSAAYGVGPGLLRDPHQSPPC